MEVLATIVNGSVHSGLLDQSADPLRMRKCKLITSVMRANNRGLKKKMEMHTVKRNDKIDKQDAKYKYVLHEVTLPIVPIAFRLERHKIQMPVDCLVAAEYPG
ncbi:hypothetical protein LOAG_16002, partial [Loa loa]